MSLIESAVANIKDPDRKAKLEQFGVNDPEEARLLQEMGGNIYLDSRDFVLKRVKAVLKEDPVSQTAETSVQKKFDQTDLTAYFNYRIPKGNRPDGNPQVSFYLDGLVTSFIITKLRESDLYTAAIFPASAHIALLMPILYSAQLKEWQEAIEYFTK